MVSSKFAHRFKVYGTPKICRPPPPPPPPSAPFPPDPIPGHINAHWEPYGPPGFDYDADYSAAYDPAYDRWYQNTGPTPPAHEISIRLYEQQELMDLDVLCQAPGGPPQRLINNAIPITWGVHQTYYIDTWDSQYHPGPAWVTVKL